MSAPDADSDPDPDAGPAGLAGAHGNFHAKLT
jgi:hypothetical protein